MRGSTANTKVDLGIIGCGGRGTWIADLFQKHGGYNLVAAADYFPDRVQKFGDKLAVPQERRFTGLSSRPSTAVTWDEILRSDERLVPDLKRLKD